MFHVKHPIPAPPPDPARDARLATYRDLQVMLPVLRGPRTAAAEPAGTYVIDTVTRDRTA